MACTSDGVKISSAALSSNASVSPPPQANSPGSSFHAVLANASAEGNATPRSTSPGPKVLGDEEQATRSDGEILSARPTARVSGDTNAADTDAGEVSGTEGRGIPSGATDTISVPATPLTVAPILIPGAAPSGIGILAMVGSSSEGPVRQDLSVASASDESLGNGPAAAAVAPTKSGAALRLPGKADRTKSQAEQKNVTALTAVTVSAVDRNTLPVVNMVSGQGLAHGQGCDASVKPEKNAASDSSLGTRGNSRTPVHGTAAGGDSGAIVLSGTTVVQQGALAPTPAQMAEANFDASTLAGLAGGLEPASGADAGQTMATLPQMGDAAEGDSGRGKTSDGTSRIKSVTGGAGDAYRQPVANATDVAQNVQGDSTKVPSGPVTTKLTDTGTAQGLVQAVMPQGATSPRVTSSAPEAPHARKAEDMQGASQLAAGDTTVSGINSAKLIQTMSETEMHVGMHSPEFGDISIRTSVSQQQMVAQISLDHNDLSQAISMHLATVQAKLGEEYGLHASIEISNQGGALSGGQGNSQPRDQQSFGSSSRGNMVAPVEFHEPSSNVVAIASAGSGHGLDIRV
jgi:hypothetical protein